MVEFITLNTNLFGWKKHSKSQNDNWFHLFMPWVERYLRALINVNFFFYWMAALLYTNHITWGFNSNIRFGVNLSDPKITLFVAIDIKLFAKTSASFVFFPYCCDIASRWVSRKIKQIGSNTKSPYIDLHRIHALILRFQRRFRLHEKCMVIASIIKLSLNLIKTW